MTFLIEINKKEIKNLMFLKNVN